MNVARTHSRQFPLPIANDEVRIGAPLFPAAWLFAIGFVISRFAWLRPSWILIALCLIAVIAGIAGHRAQRTVWIPLGALWCLLGAWCAEMQPQPSPEPALTALSDGLMRTVEGTVIDAATVRRN